MRDHFKFFFYGILRAWKKVSSFWYENIQIVSGSKCYKIKPYR